MMKKLTNKASVFELFNMLDEGEYEKNVILKSLKIAPSTFYKNIQKLKTVGFNINKKNSIYLIKRYKHVFHLNDIEKSTIAYMLNMGLAILPIS